MATVTPQQLRQWMTASSRASQSLRRRPSLLPVSASRRRYATRWTDLFAARNLVHVVERLQAGGLNPRPALRVVHAAGALALFDGDGGIGQLVGVRHGALSAPGADAWHRPGWSTAVVFPGRPGVLCHDGAVAALYRVCGDEYGAAHRHAPLGRRHADIGHNPFAVAIPQEEGPPIVLDMSLTATEPQTVQPGTLLHRQALLGGGQVARPVMGGHKGYALAVVLEILCGVLTGAGFGLYHAQERLRRQQRLQTSGTSSWHSMCSNCCRSPCFRGA